MLNLSLMGDDPAELPFSLTSVWRIYKVPVILGIFSIVCIGLSITLFIKSYQSSDPITFSSDSQKGEVIGEATSSAATSAIAVDIEGAVMKPGVYHLPPGSRVEDAIAASGGFSKKADVDAVAKALNRAAKLSDGAKLYIPSLGESASGTGSGMDTSGTAGQSGLIAGRAVNINRALQSELEALTGIGPVTAGKMIAGRPYTRLEELVEKKALSPSLFAKLKDQLTL